MNSLVQMVAAGGCLCKECSPPVQMEKKEWSDHTIPDPAQVWVTWQCPKCGYWVIIRFDNDYDVPHDLVVYKLLERSDEMPNPPLHPDFMSNRT